MTQGHTVAHTSLQLIQACAITAHLGYYQNTLMTIDRDRMKPPDKVTLRDVMEAYQGLAIGRCVLMCIITVYRSSSFKNCYQQNGSFSLVFQGVGTDIY